MFSGYYSLSSNERADLWKTAVVAFDTSALLELYRYEEYTKTLFKILDVLRREDRLWLPYHIAAEFFKNRDAVILASNEQQKDICKTVKDFMDSGVLNAGQRGRVVVADVQAKIQHALLPIHAELKSTKPHSNDTNDDEILKELTVAFQMCTGKKPEPPQAASLYEECKRRHAEGRPPYPKGSKDESKKVNTEGDALIWLELLDICKSKDKGLIFVLAEKKDDWWLKHGAQLIGPRRELIQEFAEKVGHSYQQYLIDGFIKAASEYYGIPNVSNALAEAREAILSHGSDGVYPQTTFDYRSPVDGLGIARMAEEVHFILAMSKKIHNATVHDPEGNDDVDSLATLQRYKARIEFIIGELHRIASVEAFDDRSRRYMNDKAIHASDIRRSIIATIDLLSAKLQADRD